MACSEFALSQVEGANPCLPAGRLSLRPELGPKARPGLQAGGGGGVARI